VVYFGLPSFFLVLSAVLAEKRFNIVAPTMVRVMGDASYSTYLSHVLVISAVGRMWAWGFPAHTLPWGTIFAVIAALTAGWLSFRFIEFPLNSKLRKIFRGVGRDGGQRNLGLKR
jgi:peptidoglycan/LPS O-acetylase OafA/YrhL